MREARRGQTKTGEGRRDTSLRTRLRSLHRLILRICGMPDYEGYVRHLAACHPGRAVPTERQFFEEYLKARYEGGPTRCC